MSVESAKSFLEKMKTDDTFAKQIKDAADVEARKALVKSAGFDFTQEELAEVHQGELSDEELDSVAGGGYICFGDTDVCGYDGK